MDDFTSPWTSHTRPAWWALVFGLNLIVPLLFGWTVTSEGGRIGMVAGVGLLWYLGHRLCAMSDPIGRALVGGGIVVGLAQLFPVAHICVGVASVEVANAVLQQLYPDKGMQSAIGGLIATGMMGLVMMIVAACIGAIGDKLFRRRPRVAPTPASVSQLYDRHLDA
jgi:hypothetical protein